MKQIFLKSGDGSYTLYDFDLTSAIICQNQCKLAKVRVRPHDFQCFRQTAYTLFDLDLFKTFLSKSM
jgi:hypothetical protein